MGMSYETKHDVEETLPEKAVSAAAIESHIGQIVFMRTRQGRGFHCYLEDYDGDRLFCRIKGGKIIENLARTIVEIRPARPQGDGQ
jgi:hypothetical protein